MNTLLVPAAAICLAVLTSGCDRILPQRADLSLPSIEIVDSIYRAHGVRITEVEFNGNVLEVRAVQPVEQLQRGGSLWARVGPYVYLFNPATRDLFEGYPGVAAVRAITETRNGTEIARARLLRDALNELSWRRAINSMSAAVTQGTGRPRRIEELVVFGEGVTDHEYNPRYVPPR